MNPGLVVKLRPAGPWRIGSDSGARNRVDALYHSDTLYSAVTGAMLRLGSLEEWLDATARSASPAVCFGSLYPFMDGIAYIVPPRTIWPPAGPGMQARVRWKSARFVPLEVVRSILAGQKLDQDEWVVDGPSECLAPAGRPGPFRTAVRWSAAVDRLTGCSERHSTACLEFRFGGGLWTVVSFADEAARDRWQDPVKAAFRLLADSGFGGERSRGWGRSEAPEFIEGVLPDMILPSPEPASTPAAQDAAGREQPAQPQASAFETSAQPDNELPVREPEPEPEIKEPPAPETPLEEPPAEPSEGEASVSAPELSSALEAAPEIPNDQGAEVAQAEEQAAEAQQFGAATEIQADAVEQPSGAEREPAVSETPPVQEEPPAADNVAPHWLLSMFAPGAEDAVNWERGEYVVLSRGGRVESPAGSGEPKKLLNMVAEGSVIFASAAPRGAAVDVAPDNFAHPVYRAGFALSIPLPEVR